MKVVQIILFRSQSLKPKKSANEERNRVITELNNKTFVILDKVKVEDFFTFWLEKIMKPHITSNSYDSYKNIVYNYINPLLGNHKLATLNENHIITLYKTVMKKSKSTVRICKPVINAALTYALDNHLVGYNASLGVSLPKDSVENKPFRTLNINSKNVRSVLD